MNIQKALHVLKQQMKSFHYHYYDSYERVKGQNEMGIWEETYQKFHEKIPCRLEWKNNSGEGIDRTIAISEMNTNAILYHLDEVLDSGIYLEVYYFENGNKMNLGSFQTKSRSLIYGSHYKTNLERWERYSS